MRPGYTVYPQGCPNIKAHTPAPESYLAWHAWAERKQKTHRVTRCPECELWSIWVPRKKWKAKTK